MYSAYDEILDFVTSAPALEEILAFKHSPTTLERVIYLERAEADGTINEAEKLELREFEKAAYFIEQLKLRAARRIKSGDNNT